MWMNPMMKSLNELGVPRGANFQQIKQAYRQAALCYHPDSSRGIADPERFRRVTEAFQYLREAYCHSTTTIVEQAFSDSFKAGEEQNPEEKTAVELSLEELINCVEHSPNPHVRQVALETIAARRECRGYQFLQDLIHQWSFESRMEVIQALGQRGLEPAREILFPLIGRYNLETSAAAIRALEQICAGNRAKVIQRLSQEVSDWKMTLRHPFLFLKNFLFGSSVYTGKLGDLLVRTRLLSQDQLELALLLQKRFPLLLGQILRHLGYLSIPELQHAISLQRNYRLS